MGCLVDIPCLFLQVYAYSIQDKYKFNTRRVQVRHKTSTRQVQDEYKTTKPPNTNVSATLSKNQTVFDQVPTRRGAAYRQVGITRSEGSRLCSFLGYGLREPLTSSQVNRLLELAQLFQPWKEKGFSVNTFLAHYSSEEN